MSKTEDERKNPDGTCKHSWEIYTIRPAGGTSQISSTRMSCKWCGESFND